MCSRLSTFISKRWLASVFEYFKSYKHNIVIYNLLFSLFRVNTQKGCRFQNCFEKILSHVFRVKTEGSVVYGKWRVLRYTVQARFTVHRTLMRYCSYKLLFPLRQKPCYLKLANFSSIIISLKVTNILRNYKVSFGGKKSNVAAQNNKQSGWPRLDVSRRVSKKHCVLIHTHPSPLQRLNPF